MSGFGADVAAMRAKSKVPPVTRLPRPNRPGGGTLIGRNFVTASEAGVPGHEVGVWFGIVATAGTPREGGVRRRRSPGLAPRYIRYKIFAIQNFWSCVRRTTLTRFHAPLTSARIRTKRETVIGITA